MLRWLRMGTALLLLASPTIALVCSFFELSEDERFAEASAVFLARVVQTEETGALTPVSDRRLPIIVARFQVIESSKASRQRTGR